MLQRTKHAKRYFRKWICFYCITVEPVLKDHHIGHKNVVKTGGLW